MTIYKQHFRKKKTLSIFNENGVYSLLCNFIVGIYLQDISVVIRVHSNILFRNINGILNVQSNFFITAPF